MALAPVAEIPTKGRTLSMSNVTTAADQNPFAPLVAMIAGAVAERLKAGTPERLMTVAEAAKYLGRTPWAVRSLIASEALPVVREGRSVHLDRKELDRWIDVRTVRG
jgi:excisionase family DNA binding protein